MKKGKEIGKFSFKAISYRILPQGRMEVNIVGSATGFQRVVETVTASAYGGPFSLDGIATTDSGETVHAHAEGVAESRGNGKFSTEGVLHGSDGRTIMFDGEIDRPAETWAGKMYEATE